jgi:hypothetical protein
MLAFSNVLNFLTHECASLRRWRLSLSLGLSCSLERLLFRHASTSLTKSHEMYA